MYGLNMTRAPVSIFPGDCFDTPQGVLTVSIQGNGNLIFRDATGAVVPVHQATFQFTAHRRAMGRQVWPRGQNHG